MKKHIRFSKTANSWVVTTIDDTDKKKTIQKQEWIADEDKALEFYKAKEIK